MTLRSLLSVMLVCILPALSMNPALAARVTVAPGSPGATTTIDGRYLPNPPPEFKGEISPNAAGSKPYWPELIVPPEGAPNVLLIMIDDEGFGAPSTFGGVIPTPAMDRIADARRAAYRSQPPLGGHRRRRRPGDRLPGL